MGREPILDSFAHHGALFARNGEHVVVFLRRNGFAKRHIEVLQRPVRMAALHVAQLKVIDPQALRQMLGLLLQRGGSLFMECSNAAIHGKGQTSERLAEQPTLDMPQW